MRHKLRGAPNGLESMFDTIILLAGEAERFTLPLVLLGHNPLLTVLPVGTSTDLAALDPDVFPRAR